LNPLTAYKLDHYLSSLQEGLSETANKGEIFDQQMLHQQSKHKFIEDIGDIALFATQIPLSMFKILFHQRFERHLMMNQRLKYYSSSIFKCSQNHMKFPFVLEIFPHSCYGVSDVASLLLLLVQ
jgi:hypothetical protein